MCDGKEASGCDCLWFCCSWWLLKISSHSLVPGTWWTFADWRSVHRRCFCRFASCCTCVVLDIFAASVVSGSYLFCAWGSWGGRENYAEWRSVRIFCFSCWLSPVVFALGIWTSFQRAFHRTWQSPVRVRQRVVFMRIFRCFSNSVGPDVESHWRRRWESSQVLGQQG